MAKDLDTLACVLIRYAIIHLHAEAFTRPRKVESVRWELHLRGYIPKEVGPSEVEREYAYLEMTGLVVKYFAELDNIASYRLTSEGLLFYERSETEGYPLIRARDSNGKTLVTLRATTARGSEVASNPPASLTAGTSDPATTE